MALELRGWDKLVGDPKTGLLTRVGVFVLLRAIAVSADRREGICTVRRGGADRWEMLGRSGMLGRRDSTGRWIWRDGDPAVERPRGRLDGAGIALGDAPP